MNDFEFNEVLKSIVGGAVLTVIVVFLFSALSVGMSFTETFEVTVQTTQELVLNNTPSGSVVVEGYDGTVWDVIDDTYITVNGNVVIVNEGGL
jgi:hypothetical protein